MRRSSRRSRQWWTSWHIVHLKPIASRKFVLIFFLSDVELYFLVPSSISDCYDLLSFKNNWNLRSNHGPLPFREHVVARMFIWHMFQDVLSMPLFFCWSNSRRTNRKKPCIRNLILKDRSNTDEVHVTKHWIATYQGLATFLRWITLFLIYVNDIPDFTDHFSLILFANLFHTFPVTVYCLYWGTSWHLSLLSGKFPSGMKKLN